MRIGIPAETGPGETRVAGTPETVKKLVAQKHAVMVQAGAGLASSQPDEAYVAAGATIVAAAEAAGAPIVLRGRRPSGGGGGPMAGGGGLGGVAGAMQPGGMPGVKRGR